MNRFIARYVIYTFYFGPRILFIFFILPTNLFELCLIDLIQINTSFNQLIQFIYVTEISSYHFRHLDRTQSLVAKDNISSSVMNLSQVLRQVNNLFWIIF